MLGWRIGWKGRDFFDESPLTESIPTRAFIDSDYCVAGDTCLKSAVEKNYTNFRPRCDGANET